MTDLVSELLSSFWIWAIEFVKDNVWALTLAVLAFFRATGITVDSGQTGLKFSFGRATKQLDQGFHLMIPFLQTVRVVPTRSRTLDLPRQRIATLDGLVLVVETNLVYRIVDVRKALIQIDDLERGMLQTFGLSVQSVLRGVDGRIVKLSEELDQRLEAALTEPLALWGVDVERARFTSITPDDVTLRVTQLQQRTSARQTTWEVLARRIPARRSLMLLGTRTRYLRRGTVLRREERERRQRRYVTPLLREGHTRAQLHRAEMRLAETSGSKAARDTDWLEDDDE